METKQSGHFSLIGAIFPMFAAHKANQKVLEDLNEDLTTLLAAAESEKSVSLEALKEHYSDAVHEKEKLEDKAKITLIGVSITTALIFLSTGLITTITNNFYVPYSYITPMYDFQRCLYVYPYAPVVWIATALFGLGVLYLLSALMLSVKVLCKERKSYSVSLAGMLEDKAVLRKEYAQSIAQNRAQNALRDRSVSGAFQCVRNGLICLAIVLLLAIIPPRNYNVYYAVPETAIPVVQTTTSPDDTTVTKEETVTEDTTTSLPSTSPTLQTK